MTPILVEVLPRFRALRIRSRIGLVAVAWSVCLASHAAPDEPPAHDQRLRAMEQEVLRLRRELDGLEISEKGLLGEVERLGVEIRLRESELETVSLRLEGLTRTVAEGRAELAALEAAQEARRRYLVFRLRELYKAGIEGELSRLAGGDDARAFLSGLRYATYLSERDAKQLRAFREDASRLRRRADALVAETRRLAGTQADLERTRAALERSRSVRAQALDRIRGDRSQHEVAIGELEGASRDLGRLIGRLGRSEAPLTLDVRKFRGLLDWPSDGKVRAGFGRISHPRFRTVVPHPGLDIDAAEGSGFRSVFDGRVAFSSWLHGYGLTVIVDHGGGVVSVYTHASVLLVEGGQEVLRGQPLGKVGDTGSLQGPYLYFELREGGRPVDPIEWLRRR